MDSHPEQLEMPPFPPLQWGVCEWWEGQIDLLFGTNAELTVTPHDPSVDRIPNEPQIAALRYHLENGERIVSAVLDALKVHYDEIRPRYLGFLGEKFGEKSECIMPPIVNRSELHKLIELVHVHIHPWTKSGAGYVGLQFSCTWDEEHGFGALLHRDRVVELGEAAVSFAWQPEEADKLQ